MKTELTNIEANKLALEIKEEKISKRLKALKWKNLLSEEDKENLEVLLELEREKLLKFAEPIEY